MAQFTFQFAADLLLLAVVIGLGVATQIDAFGLHKRGMFSLGEKLPHFSQTICSYLLFRQHISPSRPHFI